MLRGSVSETCALTVRKRFSFTDFVLVNRLNAAYDWASKTG